MQKILTAPSLKDCIRAYPGCWITFCLTAEETNDQLSVMNIRMAAGAEPSRHIHQWEDETIIIHDGNASFFIGNEIISAKKGDVIFMPRNVPHHFVIASMSIHYTLITTPGGIENYYDGLGSPADDQSKSIAERHGISFV